MRSSTLLIAAALAGAAYYVWRSRKAAAAPSVGLDIGPVTITTS